MIDQRDDQAPAVSLETAVLLLLGAALGAVAAAVVAPAWLPGLVASLSGPSPKAFWYLSRASGVVAYVLVWLSVVLGLAISSRLARLWPGGPLAADLHQYASLLGLAFGVFHGLILLGDRYVGFGPVELVVPFAASAYRPFWVGLGQLGFYLAALVAFSFYVRRAIGYRAWRTIHVASFAVYAMALAHAVGAGTDAAQPVMVALYGSTGLAVYFLAIYRVLGSVREARLAPR